MDPTSLAHRSGAPPTVGAGSLLQLRGMGAGDLRSILQRARRYDPVANLPSTNTGELAGRAVALLFMEDSTRTRLSFTLACQRMGGTALDLPVKASSTNKGESDTDTARTIEAMGVDAIVVRSPFVGGAHRIAAAVRCPVINAGDGTHEHPTQGLLDAYTIAKALGRDSDFDLSGVRVAIVGDITHSRVARSAVAALGTLGASVVCVGSPELVPDAVAALGCSVERDLDTVLPTVDAVMMLRVQFERHEPQEGRSREAWTSWFREACALTRGRASLLPPHAVVLHPGPINRGLEIDPEVADGLRSLILGQVRHGVAVRMAVFARYVAAAPGGFNGTSA